MSYANGTLLTYIQADGVVFATATGSTSPTRTRTGTRNLGSALLHPALPGIIVAALAPHTLSFRPIVLPPDIVLTVLVPQSSFSLGRSSSSPAAVAAYAYFDGGQRTELRAGDRIVIDAGAEVFPCVEVRGGDTTKRWFESLGVEGEKYRYRAPMRGYPSLDSETRTWGMRRSIEGAAADEGGEGNEEYEDVEEDEIVNGEFHDGAVY